MSALQDRLIDWVFAGLERKPWRNQAWLAQHLGLSEKHVSQLLTGKVAGSLAVWDRMLEAVEIRDEVLVLPVGVPESKHCVCDAGLICDGHAAAAVPTEPAGEQR